MLHLRIFQNGNSPHAQVGYIDGKQVIVFSLRYVLFLFIPNLDIVSETIFFNTLFERSAHLNTCLVRDSQTIAEALLSGFPNCNIFSISSRVYLIFKRRMVNSQVFFWSMAQKKKTFQTRKFKLHFIISLSLYLPLFRAAQCVCQGGASTTEGQESLYSSSPPLILLLISPSLTPLLYAFSFTLSPLPFYFYVSSSFFKLTLLSSS